ncbi:Rid family detoxifying hydrolase [bacterium]|nr:Rid family detoxifying hydrolase [bacterium]
MSEKRKLPQAKGPYSLWVKAGDFIYVSGQGPLDVETGQVVLQDIQTQTRLCLQNIEAILQDAGAGLADVVKTTVFLTDMADFGRMNEVYAGFFGQVKPARTTVQAAALPMGIAVEIEAVAVDPQSKAKVTRYQG